MGGGPGMMAGPGGPGMGGPGGMMGGPGGPGGRSMGPNPMTMNAQPP